MAWSYVGTDDQAGTVPATMQPVQRPGEPLGVNIPGKRTTVPAQPREGGYDVPPEADDLYGRIRRVEGTAAGDGFVFYGGKSFTPGKEHPGDAALGYGPDGRQTHAAGPGQWQPGTWNGLKPDFREKFGRDPDFSSDADQKRMSWLNAAKVYGGEEKLRSDIAAGKLDTGKLAPQWAGFNAGGGKWAVTQTGKWKVADKAVAYEQGRSGSHVVWMSPDDYLGMVPESDGDSPKRRSLAKSLSLGEDIDAIPTLDATVKDGRLKIVDQDGRARAAVAKSEGVGMIPVAIHGAGKDAPGWIEDMRGNVRPFNFDPVPSAGPAPGVLARMPGLEPTRTEQQATAQAHQQGAAERTAADRFGTGVRDIVGGAAQLASHVMPKGLEQAINALNNTLADAGVPLARIPEGGVDQMERDRARQIEQERAAAGEKGTDWWRVGGQMAALAPLARIPGFGAGMTRVAATGAAGGAAGAALSPVTEGDFWRNKAIDTGIGALTGVGLGVGTNAIAALIAPPLRNAARELVDMGVRLTPGRMMGRFASGIEDKLTSLPLVGDIMASGMRRSLEDFNRAVYRKVLDFAGIKGSPKSAGYEGVADVESKLAGAYDALKSKIQFKSDPAFERDLAELASLVKEMPRTQADQFVNIVNNRVVQRLMPRGHMDGGTFKQVESELSTFSRQYHSSSDAAQRQLADAIDTVNLALRENLERVNPLHAKELRALNTGWAAFKRLQSAAARRVGSEGVFSPGDLLAAERTMSGKASFARGDGLLRDIAQAAQDVLPSKVPDSGTAGRAALNVFATGGLHAGGALANPAFWAAAGPVSMAYLGPAMSMARAWARTPSQPRNALAGGVRSVGQALAPTAGAIGASGPPSPIP